MVVLSAASTDPIAAIHHVTATALLIFAVLLGVWGTIQYFRDRPVSGGFRSSYLLMTGLTYVQGLLGIVAFVIGDRPTELLHIVYGIFAAIFLPGAYLYAHGGGARREAVILAGASWVVSIAYFRGIATG